MHDRVKCDQCKKEICNSFILKRHKLSVHRITPKNSHQCRKCPKFFNSERMLVKHVETKHDNTN